MRTQWLCLSSAAFLVAIGLALTFMPQELLAQVGERATGPVVLLARLTGAMALAFAWLDWLARNQRIGGIYQRPLVLANLLHFMMGSLTLLRLSTAGDLGSYAFVLLVPYAVLALWWGITMTTSPV
ncbi:MAG: hypothetical protein IT182_17745 [Acidobacteria bacterium]|nr:hypothetical protein [Acidobacteriota bacterium]